MPKVTSPLFGLGASGSVGQELSYYRHKGYDCVKGKPVLPYTRSLPQIYQRCNYQDACFWWLSLSSAQKTAYNVLARGQRKTGFNLALAYYLNNLPDQALTLHLDYLSSGLVADFSGNSNNGTVFGATPCAGRIGNAYSFDGVDDYIDCGNDASLRLTSDFTLEAWIMPDTIDAYQHILSIQKGNLNGYRWRISNTGKLEIHLADAGGVTFWQASTLALSALQWTYVAFIYGPVYLSLIINDAVESWAVQPLITHDSESLKLAVRHLPIVSEQLAGREDEVRIWSRALSFEQCLQHFTRGGFYS